MAEFRKVIDNGYVVIANDGRIGILDPNGTFIINPLYESIECVSLDEGQYHRIEHNVTYGKFSKEHPFSTKDLGQNLDKIIIKIAKYPSWERESKLIITAIDRLDLDKYFILRTESYEELFSIKGGYIENSRFDQILQLTEVVYAVRQGNLWGVFRADTKELVISCNYEQIVFEGDKVVFIQNNGYWGAKTVYSKANDIPNSFIVDIPTEYLEIKQLESIDVPLFGVKRVNKDSFGNSGEIYTIVDSLGKELSVIEDINWNTEFLYSSMYDYELGTSHITSQYTFYRWDRVLCSVRNKYGFISLDGYVAIPFKYDEVRHITEDKFDVRLGDAWGQLSLDHGEIIPIKYNTPLPEQFDDRSVCDAITKRFGILNENGAERIPSIYEYLEAAGEFYIFAINVTYNHNEELGSWVDWESCGCLDKNGKIIVPPKYKCIEVHGEYIFARREDPELLEFDYSSLNALVYDLYNASGEVLIGGFRKYEFNEKQRLFKLFFGGIWRRKYCDGPYYLDEAGGQWLIVDHTLRSIKKRDLGKGYFFTPGCLIKITNTMYDVIRFWNYPTDILFANEPVINDGYIIYLNEDSYKAIRISDGVETVSYEKLSYIGNDRFFVKVENKVGVVDFDGNEIIPITHIAITKPVDDYIFGVIENNPRQCRVVLYDMRTAHITEYVAISEAHRNDLYMNLLRGDFLIQIHSGFQGLKSITTQKPEVFDWAFQMMINEKYASKYENKKLDNYWFIGHWEFYDED